MTPQINKQSWPEVCTARCGSGAPPVERGLDFLPGSPAGDRGQPGLARRKATCFPASAHPSPTCKARSLGSRHTRAPVPAWPQHSHALQFCDTDTFTGACACVCTTTAATRAPRPSAPSYSPLTPLPCPPPRSDQGHRKQGQQVCKPRAKMGKFIFQESSKHAGSIFRPWFPPRCQI